VPIVERLPPQDLGETNGGLLDPLISNGSNVRIDHGEERSNFLDDLRCDRLRTQIGPATARPPGSEAARAVDQLAEQVSAVGRHFLGAA
jgi:hypothetical protein